MQILCSNLALVKNVDIASSICIIVEVIAEEFSWIFRNRCPSRMVLRIVPDTISKMDGLAIGANYARQIMTSLQLEQYLLLLTAYVL